MVANCQKNRHKRSRSLGVDANAKESFPRSDDKEQCETRKRDRSTILILPVIVNILCAFSYFLRHDSNCFRRSPRGCLYVEIRD